MSAIKGVGVLQKKNNKHFRSFPKLLKQKREHLVNFTLLELLIVISIIGILISILLPALAKTRTKVKSAVCINNLKQVGIASSIYVQDNDGINVPSFYP
ncbi:MAG: prepilin-type N-terminal cleavage/methylation domain-containing protein, partial [Lentisphaeraceae bacterium]|nr:prepilin-type N-terminal cleavage/methylation domain-containing protein [Lentisphaeraceae bacterium]